MKSEENIPSVEVTTLMWAVSFQARIIKDIAAAYGRSNRNAALAMIGALERALAAELFAIRDKGPEGIGTPLRQIAVELRKNLLDAKQAIEQAARPH